MASNVATATLIRGLGSVWVCAFTVPLMVPLRTETAPIRAFSSADPLDHDPAESSDVQRKTAGRTLNILQSKGGGVQVRHFWRRWSKMSGEAGILKNPLAMQCMCSRGANFAFATFFRRRPTFGFFGDLSPIDSL